jgi:amino acid transporter
LLNRLCKYSFLAGPLARRPSEEFLLTDRTSIEEAAVESDAASLKTNTLGTAGIVFLVVSAAAPLSIVAGVGPLAILIGGPSAPLVYLVAGIALLIFAIGFMAMTRYVKAVGGFYTYVTAALGKAIGLGSAFVALMSYNALQIGLYGLMGVQGAAMMKSVFNLDVPWWVIAFVGIALVFLLAYFGVDVGARVLGVLLALETVLIAVFIVAVIAQGGASGLSLGLLAPESAFNPGMFAILGIGLAAFMGFESTALYRAEARNPARTIPRATYIAVISMALFYTIALWAVVQAFGDAKVQAAAGEDVAGLFFVAIERFVGPWAQIALYILILTSIYASQLAFHNAITRYSFSLARDGILPSVLHRTQPRYGSPWVSSLAQTILAAIVVGLFVLFDLDPYLQLLLVVNSPGVIGIVALQALAGVAVVMYFARNSSATKKWYVVPAAVVGTILMAGLLVILISTIEVLTGAGAEVNIPVVLVTPIVFVIGFITARVLKVRNPQAYERIGGGE